MSEDVVDLWRGFERFDRELAKPALEKAVGTELVTVKLVAGGPGDEKGCRREEDEPPGIQ